ncbi:hypothetical protein jhhlp_005607 [Lomentospora prolificans]|uniref:Peptidyl-tRNA hydrolase n=1 Tax=Lomentospora prolificans TaxID=41688 RepID=A0A2N3N3J5_9PEZI|nr:hypothetical protein jhhlp_005607 [Lomentospora prolificans]
MRFSSTLLLAMPLAASAADSLFNQYKAQVQDLLQSFGYTGTNNAGEAKPAEDVPPTPDPEERRKQYYAEEVPVSENALSVLTLGNFKDTLYAPVQEGATTPEEWWVLISGRNKTCGGYHCLRAESAFNETAEHFATIPETPHMGLINCDNEPVLCNFLSAGVGSIWVFEMLPRPLEIDIYVRRLNLSTVEAKDIIGYLPQEGRARFRKLDSHFHPFDGTLAQYGVLLPLAYATWVFSFIPNWLFMFAVSAISRTMMTNRMRNHDERRARQNAASGGGAAPAN